MYASGDAPAKFGVIDKERHSGTPVYRYGWIISRTELYEALEGEPCHWDELLSKICLAADSQFYTFWTEMQYDNNEYKQVSLHSECCKNLFFNSPDIPCVKPLGDKYVVIYMACNDSPDIIKSIMENKEYHAECRACMGNPKTMESEPAWFRVGIKDLPKGLVG